MKKLMVCPYFGTLPDWFPRWYESALTLRPHGYHFLLDSDLPAFKQRARRRLGVDCPIVEGEGKIHDYRCALGVLYEHELAGYDFWGHTDFDVVYGRVERFWPDAVLDECDIATDHTYVLGPWTLYRNLPAVNELFYAHPDWRGHLEGGRVTGWVETAYTDVVRASGLRVSWTTEHVYEPGDLRRLRRNGSGALMVGAREVPFGHFRRTKEWPSQLA